MPYHTMILPTLMYMYEDVARSLKGGVHMDVFYVCIVT